MLLFIDNFDSFTYNLVQAFQSLGAQVHVIRNCASLKECLDLSPHALVIGPGPGSPSECRLSKQLLLNWGHKMPILGICLGHQTIAEVFGGQVIRAKEPMHGKTSPIFHNKQGLFKGLPQGFLATRYHSLIVHFTSLPSNLEVTAQTAIGEVMGLRHRCFNIESVQFHPESIATQNGLEILRNFLDKTKD